MSLILCPECENKISERAEACPHCGLPAKYFKDSVAADDAKTEKEPSLPIDLAALRNILIAFDHSYQTFFGSDHYITARELAGIQSSFGSWAEKLKDKIAYSYCKENAHYYSVDFPLC